MTATSFNQVAANGLAFAVDDRGPHDAPVILLVMGLGTQAIAWPEPLIAGLLAQGFRVIRYDNRDIGESTHLHAAPAPHPLVYLAKAKLGLRPRIAYRLADMADDAVALLDALGIERAHLVGASMGGMISQLVAVQHPSRVRSLTSIMSSSGARDLPGPSGEIRKRLMSRPARTASRETKIAASVATIKLIAYPDPLRSDAELEVMAAAAIDRGYNPMGARRQLLAIIADGCRVERLKQIGAPTLVIHGAADTLVPLACGMHTAASIPGARLEIIEKMAHDLPPGQVPRLVALIGDHAHAADAAAAAQLHAAAQ
ncbi:MAG: alpha/beta fold hydrolase [Polymorphobacter sp.]